jgi:coproporphyrinogen III oxidase
MDAHPMTVPSFQAGAIAWTAALHDDITAFFERLDGTGKFREDSWDRPGGGGGTARVMTEGAVFEKAGVNRSAVHGELSTAAAERLGAVVPPDGRSTFFAAGVSLVIHPRSPRVPTVHLNVRYFEIAHPELGVVDCWFGGGTDLTPYYPSVDDAVHFHRTLRDRCRQFNPKFYDRFKLWCDQYFVNHHRGEERRGVGGIFFDNLRISDPSGLDRAGLHAFADAIGRVLPEAYGPIVERTRHLPYGEREKHFQLVRRGRYVEFNLVHDRGTIFGLQTNARIESVLMSLPPIAAWDYAPTYAADSFEQELIDQLQPRDWLAGL